MPPSIRDVARHTGLSLSTVSRALNKRGHVSPETQRRVEEAAAALGYQPDWTARLLRGKPSHLIGLIIPDFSNTYYTSIAQAASRALRAHGYECFICSHEEDPEIDLHYLRILKQTRVDGILYAHPAHGSNSDYVRKLALAELPIVEINRQREADLLDAVLANNIQGAYQMTSYLVARGHRRSALILGETTITTGRDRFEGYRRALADAGVPIDDSYIRPGSFSRTHGEAATLELLDLPDPPTAILAASNRILLGVLSVLGRRGFSIPHDMSVVAFDDSEWLATWHPAITAVDVDIDELAQLAVDLLMQKIRGDTTLRKPMTYLLSTRIAERESCRDLGAHSPERSTAPRTSSDPLRDGAAPAPVPAGGRR
jgi:LacI family transcriptional regulator